MDMNSRDPGSQRLQGREGGAAPVRLFALQITRASRALRAAAGAGQLLRPQEGPRAWPRAWKQLFRG